MGPREASAEFAQSAASFEELGAFRSFLSAIGRRSMTAYLAQTLVFADASSWCSNLWAYAQMGVAPSLRLPCGLVESGALSPTRWDVRVVPLSVSCAGWLRCRRPCRCPNCRCRFTVPTPG